MENPDAVEVDQKVGKRTFFVVGLEECAIPIDSTKLGIPLRRSNVDETGIIREDNLRETFWIPEELINIIVSNNFIVVLFPSDKFTIQNLVTLVSYEIIQRFYDPIEINSFWDRIWTILTLRTAIIVVGTFEDEAQALWNKANVSCLAPAKKPERDLAEPVILAHPIHGTAPSIQSTIKGLGACICVTLDTLEPLQTWILRLANSIIKIKLSSKVPLPIIGILTANIIGMDCEKSLVWSHAGGAGIEQMHQEVKLECEDYDTRKQSRMTRTILRMESL